MLIQPLAEAWNVAKAQEVKTVFVISRGTRGRGVVPLVDHLTLSWVLQYLVT